jgi:SAM-dependent methyltransferase
MTLVTYSPWQQALDGYPDLLRKLVANEAPRSVCDVGGGAHAAFNLDEVASLEYTLLDISEAELGKSPDGYRKVHADIAEPGLGKVLGERFDLVLSNMVAEHVADPEEFHHNVLDVLRPGGIAVHLMPTMWEPAFVLNRLLPERAAAGLLRRFQPARRVDADQGKFPAYYRWCRGPGQSHIRRFEGLGYEVVAVHGFFGTGYARRVPGVRAVVEAWTKTLMRRPVPWLTSYCVLVLRKPDHRP